MRKFSIEDDFSQFYKENGFVIFRDLYSEDKIQAARDNIEHLFVNAFPTVKFKDLRELITHSHSIDKVLWRNCVRMMWYSPHIVNMVEPVRITNVLRRLGLANPFLSTHQEVRTDMPGDNLYFQPWHQDWPYACRSFNSVTIWIALHSVVKADGAIKVVPGSHLHGFVRPRELSNPRRFVIEGAEEKYEKSSVTVELKASECVVFSQFLLHSSGINSTQLVRLSTQQRYCDISEKAFLDRKMEVINGFNGGFLPDKTDILKVF